jgi:hypothetical protein
VSLQYVEPKFAASNRNMAIDDTYTSCLVTDAGVERIQFAAVYRSSLDTEGKGYYESSANVVILYNLLLVIYDS